MSARSSIFVALALVGCGSAIPAAVRPDTIVVLPDTQYATCYIPDTFRAQVEWIARMSNEHVAAVLHVGDIVEHPFSRSEWDVASGALHLLDGKIPYVVVPGNHDLGLDRTSLINDYFAPERLPWVIGVMEPHHIENSYSLIEIGDHIWLIVGLEYAPRDAVVDWAENVIRQHADVPVILLTHAYLDGADGSRYYSPGQFGYPTGLNSAAGINDGEMLWHKLVEPNSNIRLVLCGHHMIAKRISTRADGSVVHEVVSDYQWWQGEWNGYGYLRLMEFDYINQVIRVRTYSPTIGNFLVGSEHQFELGLVLSTKKGDVR
jgi:predicted phosphodiesterase